MIVSPFSECLECYNSIHYTRFCEFIRNHVTKTAGANSLFHEVKEVEAVMMGMLPPLFDEIMGAIYKKGERSYMFAMLCIPNSPYGGIATEKDR